MEEPVTGADERIDSRTFYTNYFGHPPVQLERLVAQKPKDVPTIYFVGDSTLDNKFWIPNRHERHPNAHVRSMLDAYDPVLCRDVCYWLSRLYGSDRYTVVNCAVEQTLLRTRGVKLYPQDEIVREHLGADDVLVVSVGGNDIALSPTLWTALAVLGNVLISPNLGMSTFVRLFRDAIQAYVCDLVSKRKPKLVIICMLYYPDENADAQSWASLVLQLLQYNSHPAKLQRAINNVFDRAIKHISVPGTTVAFAPFFRALDGKDTSHYVARVEPSEEGGRLMAELLKSVIEKGVHRG